MPALTNANPFSAYRVAEEIRDCIIPYLEMTTQGIPDRQCIVSGEIAWDDCECGQLAVGIVDSYESYDGTTPATGADTTTGQRPGCGATYFVVNYVVSMLRCAPTFGNNGQSPTCEEVSEAAKISTEDAWAVRAGMVCCFDQLVSTRQADGTKLVVEYRLGTQTRTGADGICQGSLLDVTVVLQNGCYPCVEES